MSYTSPPSMSSITTQILSCDSKISWQLRMYLCRTCRRMSSSICIDSSSLKSFRSITLIANRPDLPCPRLLPLAPPLSSAA